MSDDAAATATDSAVETGPILELQLEQLFPGIGGVSVEIGAIDPDTGHPNHVDMLYVVAMARHLKARRIFEFGTYLGRTTRHLAGSDPEVQVFTLDLHPSAPKPPKLGAAVSAVLDRGLQGYFYKQSPAAGRVVQLHGDTRLFDYTPFHRTMDFIFVDASHLLEQMRNDTSHALDLLAPGGTIVWHDYAEKSPDVMQVLDDLGRERPLFHIQKTSLVVYADGLHHADVSLAPAPYARKSLKG